MEEIEAIAEEQQTEPVVINPNFKWYAITTQSGMERKAIDVLAQRIKRLNLSDAFGQIVIPMQTIEKIDDKGKKKLVEQRLMPGYVLVQMEMNDPSYHCVKDTPKISNFIGATNNKAPPAMPDEEVDRVINRSVHVAREIAARPKKIFEKGEKVRVIDGPFTNFMGEIDEVKPDRSKLRLLISVFGRPTPVEIEFSKVEKVIE